MHDRRLETEEREDRDPMTPLARRIMARQGMPYPLTDPRRRSQFRREAQSRQAARRRTGG